jgi:hypothetical protein
MQVIYGVENSLPCRYDMVSDPLGCVIRSLTDYVTLNLIYKYYIK